MSVSGTSDVKVDRKRVVFKHKLHLVKSIVGGNADDYGEVRFWEEGLTVVYRGDTHCGAGGIILSYISNR